MGTDNPDIKKEALYQFIYSAFGGLPIVNQVIQSIAAKIKAPMTHNSTRMMKKLKTAPRFITA
jgi:hypothetical protein